MKRFVAAISFCISFTPFAFAENVKIPDGITLEFRESLSIVKIENSNSTIQNLVGWIAGECDLVYLGRYFGTESWVLPVNNTVFANAGLDLSVQLPRGNAKVSIKNCALTAAAISN